MAARLQRYEELLHRHGIRLEELDYPSTSKAREVASTNIGGDNPSHESGIAGKDGLPLYTTHTYVTSQLCRCHL